MCRLVKLTAKRKTKISDRISDIFNNTGVSASSINKGTDEHGLGCTLDNVPSSACTPYFNVNNETEDISLTKILDNVTSLTELVGCVDYGVNGSRTAGEDWLHRLNITLDNSNSSMSYDNQWCKDM